MSQLAINSTTLRLILIQLAILLLYQNCGREFVPRFDKTQIINSGGGFGQNLVSEQYPQNPFEIRLNQNIAAGDVRGSIFAHELNGDGRVDFVVTAPNSIGVYANRGAPLWVVNDDIYLPGAANGGSGYPGIHGPGAIAGDMDGDGRHEVAYLTSSGLLKFREGATGNLRGSHSFPGAQAIAIANFRGLGDRDAVIQFNQTTLRAIALETGQTLWQLNNFIGLEHTQVRVTDMNGDGRDDVVGAEIINGQNGQRLHGWNMESDRGTEVSGIDSIIIADIQPGGGLEFGIAETGGNNETVVANTSSIRWGTYRDGIPPSGQCAREIDPDKLAVGDFDTARPGLEIFARSACGLEPWIMDANGNIISTWRVLNTAPAGWCVLDNCGGRDTEGGLEKVRSIDWDGSGRNLLFVKERHVDGKAALLDPLNGNFLRVFNTRAVRTYSADVSGDYREEIVVMEAGGAGAARLLIYWNEQANNNSRPRHWTQNVYRRLKQNWNYYSP